MVIVDGIGYDIDVLHLKRTADFLDKYAERTESGDLKRELIGVYFNYKLELGPGIKPDEYARFWRKLTEPVESTPSRCPTRRATTHSRRTFPTWATSCCARRGPRTTGRA